MKRNRKRKSSNRGRLLLAVACFLCAFHSGILVAQPEPMDLSPEDIVPRLKFNSATLDIVLDDYAEKTARTLLRAPGLPNVTITLQSEGDLDIREYLQAIETVLSMNNIALLEVGDKFLKVVPIKQARQEGMAIEERGEEPLEESDRLVSQMIPLTHITIDEARKAVEALKHAYGMIHLFERTNSMLVTDTAVNINRIAEIISYIDQPVEAREEPHIIVIRHAKASEIKGKLEQIIADQQKEAEKSTVPRSKSSGSPGVVKSTPGVIRARKRAVPAVEAPTVAELVEMAERGIIRGKVKIIADERTNVLIILTRPENMRFFEKIVKVLDVETEPDVLVRVIRLEYSSAETVASTLNALIGKAEKKPETAVPAREGKEESAAGLTEYVERLREARAEKEKSKIGELSAANIKILADKRTNALIIMSSRADFAAIEEIVLSMDMMLSQVLIEVVIFKIGLIEDHERGIDWVQRALMTYDQNADGTRTPISTFGGSGGGASDRARMKDPLTLTTLADLASSSGNLTYYFTFFQLNLDAIVKFVASDNRSEIVASPRILTTDNKEASINVTKEKYFFKGLKFVSTSGSGGGEWVDDVVMRKVGTKLTVTPHINQKKFVVMEITQTLEEEGAGQDIVGGGGITTTWPTIDSSELTASVAVRTGETIVLGGLVSNTLKDEESKVPLFGDLPIVGNLFKSVTKNDNRSEVVVFITPYVLDTPEEIEAETVRRRQAMEVAVEWPAGSHSEVAEVDPAAGQDDEERKAIVERLVDARKRRQEEKATAEAEPEEAETVEEPVVEPEPEPEPEPVVAKEPEIDPALLKFIRREDSKWGRRLRRVDKRVEAGLSGSPGK